MKLVLASDHAGFHLKQQLVSRLKSEGHQVLDLGAFSTESVDYTDYAQALCQAVLDGKAERGILICNSGVGMSIAANRFKGIRAALCLFPRMAYYARRHNNANVLAMGGGNTGFFTASEIVDVFLSEEFEGGRHKRRTDKFDLVEVK
ncbi:MAG: ribose 5-phosphate isomerase B [Candidatus Fermentibacteraceae bacterium]|nr:ribose 5-phosphate isomerase B [Candidatus Fermentibacteraceae bacterium]